ncbi:MAG TPA: hypothetical protein ENK66_11475 [Arcobacter sp.]|nr:hypothetical protein [Arcobacter sp.]
MDIILSNEDIEWINTQYPNLTVDILNKNISGDISFKRDYEKYEISDTYSIRISLEKKGISILPKVISISDKIRDIAKKYNIDLDDLHINSDGSFCLVIDDREEELFENGFTIKEFFQNSLEPFLFQMSYYEREGKFPWGEYAHGRLGYIELYAENGISLDKLLSFFDKREIISLVLKTRQSDCLCGSGKKMRKCHPLIFKGIQKIR